MKRSERMRSARKNIDAAATRAAQTGKPEDLERFAQVLGEVLANEVAEAMRQLRRARERGTQRRKQKRQKKAKQR